MTGGSTARFLWPAPGLLALAAACSPSTRLAVPAPDPLDRAETVVYLVGDAGQLDSANKVLDRLASDVRSASRAGKTVVVTYLGDNIYTTGMRPVSHPGYTDDTLRLNPQIRVVDNTDARAIFVPGNHDWDHSGADGLNAIIRQGNYLDTIPRVELLPAGGCPGPVIRDFGPSASAVGSRGMGVRLVAFDSEWWLWPPRTGRGSMPPPDAGIRQAAYDASCPTTVAEVTAAFRSAIQDTSRNIVVLSHHPLTTHGPHGGHMPINSTLNGVGRVLGALSVVAAGAMVGWIADPGHRTRGAVVGAGTGLGLDLWVAGGNVLGPIGAVGTGALIGSASGGYGAGGTAAGGGIGMLFTAIATWGGTRPLPWIRYSGVRSDEDLVGKANREMVDSLAAVYRENANAPLVHAAGHEHSLQVIQGDEYGMGWMLVSGSAANSTPVKRDGSTGYATREKGYMRLEFAADGVRLTVVSFGRDGGAGVLAWCRWLKGGLAGPGCSN